MGYIPPPVKVATSRPQINGSRLLTVGDSISDPATAGGQGHTWLTTAEYGSGGRLRRWRSLATSGDTSSQQLTKVRELIAAGGTMPTCATVLVGANNLSGSEDLQFPTWKADIAGIAADLRAVGCEPILCTLTPRSGPATQQTPAIINGKWNAWLRKYARDNGYALVDLWRVVTDPATGQWRAGWANPADGVHPFTDAHNAMGAEVQRVLYPLLAATTQARTVSLFDGNIIAGGVVTTAARPVGWLASTGNGWAYPADVSAPGGFCTQLVSDVNPATTPQQRVRSLIADGTWAAGDLITATFTYRVESATDVSSGNGVACKVIQYNNVATPIGNETAVFGQRTPTAEYLTVSYDTAIVAGCVDLRLQFEYLKGSSPVTNQLTARLGAWGIYNNTRGELL